MTKAKTEEKQPEEQGQAPTTDILASMYVIFDRNTLFTKRKEGDGPFYTLVGMHLLEESAYTLTYLTNPELGLSRYDMAYLLTDDEALKGYIGTDNGFIESWLDLRSAENEDEETGRPLPLSWGLQFNWSNAQIRIPGSLFNDFEDAMLIVDDAFDTIKDHAENTVSVATGLMLLNGIMQATLQQKKPAAKTARKEGN